MPAVVSRYAVIGHPIAHSLSPRLHALFAAQTGIALEYTAIDVASAVFADTVHTFLAHGGRGANVTLPHKAAAFAIADVQTATAQRLGVANVLTRLPNGRIEADSNDGAGMLADMHRRCGIDPRDRKSTRLNSSHVEISYAVFCLKKKTRTRRRQPPPRRFGRSHTRIPPLSSLRRSPPSPRPSCAGRA